jgi:hypothetical protein
LAFLFGLTSNFKEDFLIMEHKIREVDEYVDEREVKRITKRALPTLRNDRFNKRGIPYVKLGRSVRYRLADVLEFMESRKIDTKGF